MESGEHESALARDSAHRWEDAENPSTRDVYSFSSSTLAPADSMTADDPHARPEAPSSEADLPPIPSDADDSFAKGMAEASEGSHLRSDNDDSRVGDDSAVVERDMRRKLMDIESSFIPADGAQDDSVQHSRRGVDDTFLFGGSPGNGLRQTSEGKWVPQEEDFAHLNGKGNQDTPAAAHKAPSSDQDRSFGDGSRSTAEPDSSTVDVEPSSPLAAAAHRSKGRDATTPEPTVPDEPQGSAQTVQDLPRSSVDAPAADEADDFMASPRSTISSSTLTKGRPGVSHSRQLSQLSTASGLSHYTEFSMDGTASSDNTLGADNASQLGGNGPLLRGFSRDSLPRLPSTSSIGSSLPDLTDSGFSGSERPRLSARPSGLEPLDEEGPVPITPKAGSSWTGLNSTNPTDTVIAQHVQNIKVPETVAREYRQLHGATAAPSPEKRTTSLRFGRSSTTAGTGKSNLTLKEQNSKIDKLSKENFDLKLKIHFLDQALQNRSDEGVREMISKNVQLQTDLANERKESQSLRRKVRDLERRIKQSEDQDPQQRGAGMQESDEDKSTDSRFAELEEEITYLRECLTHSESQADRMREEGMAREVERRKLAEHIKNMSDTARSQSADNTGVEEAMEMWKDLLEAETARREQADEDALKLREEVQQLKSQLSQRPVSAGHTSTHHVRNFYNINKRQQFSYNGLQHGADGRSVEGLSTTGGFPGGMPIEENGAVRPSTANGSLAASSVTLIEQLKHENAELRRDLGAQTSMLTSRNRERERLQQEIEDLKLHNRRAGGLGGQSIAGDSIFERSVSRQGQVRHNHEQGHTRSASRLSAGTGLTRGNGALPEDAMSDFEHEREEWEQKISAVRDDLATTKLLNQDLERELNAHLDILTRVEEENKKLQEEHDALVEDLQGLQAERDEALLGLDEKENEVNGLREEALDRLEELEDAIAQKEEELQNVNAALENKNADFHELQTEMRAVSESLVALEDDAASKRRKITSLENDVQEGEREIEELEKRIREHVGKNERLEVQLESTQSEVSFLREEQEGDKIKIGELEASLTQAQQAYQEEKERLEEERRQREVVIEGEKDEVQKMVAELNGQLGKARDEVRKLRKSLSSKEVEAQQWKDRLDMLEGGLKEALGDINGTRTSFLKDIQELQKSLDNTSEELELTRAGLAEKDRLLRNRDALLESTGLESRKLSDLLDKERLARRQERNQFELQQRQHTQMARQIQSHDSRVHEMEQQRGVDKRRMAVLEDKYKGQLEERNNLLLALWNRLATLCGTDFMQKHSLIDGQLPTMELIGKNLHGFNKSIILAVKTVEGTFGTFRSRIRNIEKDLWRDFQTLEYTLDVRAKRLEQLERALSDGSLSPSKGNKYGRRSVSRASSHSGEGGAGGGDYARLKSENKLLKAELQFHRATGSTPAASIVDGAQPLGQNINSGIAPPLVRGYTTSALESFPQQHNSYGAAATTTTSLDAIPDSPGSPQTAFRADGTSAGFGNGGSGSGSGSRPTTSRRDSTSTSVSAKAPLQPSEAKWIHRLKELERRLKAEREARLLDRSGARSRLKEERETNEQLSRRLEREKLLRQESID